MATMRPVFKTTTLFLARRPSRRPWLGLLAMVVAVVVASCAQVDPSIVTQSLGADTGGVTGLVTDGTAPLPGVAINTVPATAGGATDSAGRFVLGPLSAQTLTVVAQSPGFTGGSRTVTILPGRTVTADIVMAATAAPAAIRGVVTDGLVGQVGATVTSIPPTGSFITGPDGLFSLVAPPAATVRLEASKPGFISARVDRVLTPGIIADVVLAMTRRNDGAISGIVTDGTNPVGSAQQRVTITVFDRTGRRVLSRPDIANDPPSPPRPQFPTPLLLTYVFDSLPTGTYTLEAQLPGFVPGIKIVEVVPPRPANGDIILSTNGSTGAVAGTVFDPFDQVLPGALVGIGPVSAPATSTTTSDVDGRFRFPALTPGQFDVTVTGGLFAAGRLPVVVIGGQTTDGTIKLER